MTTLQEAFLEKYPKYGVILRMFEEANGCAAEWGELSKLRIIRFTEYMGERVSPNSARQYAAKLKAVLNRYSDEVKLDFDEGALRAIARKAMKKDTGARALRAIIEDFMLDIMYEIPKDDSIGQVTITESYIEGTGGPVITLRGQEPLRLEG